jgi:hypothetical protein
MNEHARACALVSARESTLSLDLDQPRSVRLGGRALATCA